MECFGPKRTDAPVPSNCVPVYRQVPLSCISGASGERPSEAQCVAICGHARNTLCVVTSVEGMDVRITCPALCAVGRRPSGFRAPDPDPRQSQLGTHFARSAVLEHASVFAFRHLRAELAVRGAPRRLLARISRAMRDERRHTRSTRSLARRFGARVELSRLALPAGRTLEQIALENAVEGCVRETYGALVAWFQAESARDPAVRATMRRIAREETQHAALSYEIQAWLEPRLSVSARARVTAARDRARAELARELEARPAQELVDIAGLPDRTRALQLFAALEQRLWSPAHSAAA